jgi:hypothetical protein
MASRRLANLANSVAVRREGRHGDTGGRDVSVRLRARPGAAAARGAPGGRAAGHLPAAEGAELHGYLYLPPGKGPFPAVLWNHGSEKWPGWQPGLAAFYTRSGSAN